MNKNIQKIKRDNSLVSLSFENYSNNLECLTAEFGMGSGVSRLVWSSQYNLKITIYKPFYTHHHSLFHAGIPKWSNGQDSRSCDLVSSGVRILFPA